MAKDQEAQLAAAKQELVLAYQHANAALGRFLSLVDGVDVHSSLKYLLEGGVPAFAPITHSNGTVGVKGSKKRPAETDDEIDDDDDAGSLTAKGKGKKKVKKEVDPNAPKRPASAFIIFQNAVRAEMKRENPEADHKTLAKEIGDKWKALSEEEKQPWSEMARESMARFMEERKTYELEHPDAKAKLAAINAAIKGGSKPTTTASDKAAKKRGRPSNAEKAARAEANGEPEEAVPGEKKKSKKDKSAVPAVAKPQVATSKKPTSAPPIAESSSNESSDEESEEEESSDEVDPPAAAAAAAAAAAVPRVKSAATTGKKGAAPQQAAASSSDESEESESEEDAPKPVAKKQKPEKKSKK